MANQIQLLKQLGLSEKEARLYLVALESGPTTILKLAQKCGVKRSTLYEYIGSMIERGILEVTFSGKRKLYSGAEPKKLRKLLERQEEVLDILIPDLSLMISKSPQRPKIRFYEGVEGIKQVLDDTLNQPAGSELVGYASFGAAFEALTPTYYKNYIKRRVAKKIYGRGIASSDEFAKPHIDANKKELREAIVLNKKIFPISIEMNIYQNKTAIMSFGDEKVGIIIESQQIADNQRAIFENFWKALKLLEKNKIEFK